MDTDCKGVCNQNFVRLLELEDEDRRLARLIAGVDYMSLAALVDEDPKGRSQACHEVCRRQQLPSLNHEALEEDIDMDEDMEFDREVDENDEAENNEAEQDDEDVGPICRGTSIRRVALSDRSY